MSMYPKNIPVSGGDYFNLALYHPQRFEDKPDSSCQMSMTLDASFSFDLLAETLNKSSFFVWVSKAQLNRPFPFMLPSWVDKSPTAASIIRQGNSIKTRSGISFRVEETGSRQQTLNFFWPHELMDARGAEILVKNLQSVYLTGSDLPELIDRRETGLRQKLRSLCRYHKSINQARRAVHYITRASRSPIASLTRSTIWQEPETTWHHTIDFSLTGGAYVVPLPMDLRLRGKPGPALSNHISTLTFRIERESVAHLEEIIKSLKAQMTFQIEKGVPGDCRLMMALFRRLPVGLYSKAMLGPTVGQIASFFFSDIGESLSGLEDFLGARFFGVTHFAPARKPPGLTVVFMRHRGCLKVALSYMESCLAQNDLATLSNAFKAGLLGGDQPE